MTTSLNEVEAVSKRAARGAGLEWGLAEEAGKATRWLCEQGLDGCAALAAVLSGSRARARLPEGGEWAGNGLLCPIFAGAALSDRAAMLGQGPVQMRHVSNPVLILPFAGLVARMQKRPVTVECDGVSAVTDGRTLSLPSLLPKEAEKVSVRLGGTVAETRGQSSRAAPDAGTWRALNALAHRTYAPATEESRLLGAGAGLSDND